MAIRNIVKEGDPILRKVCRPVDQFDEKLHRLLDDMHETLDKAEGVGLAAPQVGFCRRFYHAFGGRAGRSHQSGYPENQRKAVCAGRLFILPE